MNKIQKNRNHPDVFSMRKSLEKALNEPHVTMEIIDKDYLT